MSGISSTISPRMDFATRVPRRAALVLLVLASGLAHGQPTAVPSGLDFGPIVVGNSASDSIQLRNFSGSALAITAIDSVSAPFSRISSNCAPLPHTLANLDTCTLTYEFAPAANGSFSELVQVDWQAGPGNAGTISFTLEGDGQGPDLLITPRPLDFGLVRVGLSSAVQFATLDSVGATSVDVQSIQSPAAPFSFVAGGTCPQPPFSLPAGVQCSLALQYFPQGIGLDQQSVAVAANIGRAESIEMRGEGGASDITLLPPVVDFGGVDIGRSAGPLPVSVINAGTISLQVTGFAVPLLPEFSAAPGTCGAFPFQVPATGSCDLYLMFQPASLGLVQQTALLSSNALTGSGSFDLAGIGVDLEITLTPVSLDFGALYAGESSPVEAIELRNTGAETLSVAFALTSVPLNNPFLLQAGSCPDPVTLGVGQSCELRYRFSPAAVGTFSLAGQAVSNAASSPDPFTLTGRALDPTIFVDGFEMISP